MAFGTTIAQEWAADGCRRERVPTKCGDARQPAPTPNERRPEVSNLSEINRVVHRHEWVSLGEWVDSLDKLADLSDRELEELGRMDAGSSKPRAQRR